LVRPQTLNEAWSADFVFGRTAEGRVVKCLAVVDDATTEAVAIVPTRALDGLPVTRALDRLAAERGLPRALRTDNTQELCGRAMLTWSQGRGVSLRLIEPGKPTQNTYIEPINGRFRDECLNEHWFTRLLMRRSSSRPGAERTTRSVPTRPWATCSQKAYRTKRQDNQSLL
jgi:putative transposase